MFVLPLWLSPAGRPLVPSKQKRASNRHGPQNVYSRVRRHEGVFFCVNRKKAFYLWRLQRTGAAGAPPREGGRGASEGATEERQ